MIKLPFKQHLADLAELLRQKGVRDIIICPGSRNAPLMQVFQRNEAFRCYSIVDERSAGYVALGMAIETWRPVAVVTTSGTAVLNLAPAVAEAYNQHVPLIILTGDRPAETPPQFTNQRINQSNVFGPNASGFYAFPPEFENTSHLDKVMQEAANMLHRCCVESRGPVHLNLLLHEPLYGEIPTKIMTRPYLLEDSPPLYPAGLNNAEKALIREHLFAQKKVLLLAGMDHYTASGKKTLEILADRFQVAVIAENIANLSGPNAISAPDTALATALQEQLQELAPDLVVAMGGPIVSKRTRLFVQGLKDTPVVLLKDSPALSLSEIQDMAFKTGKKSTGPNTKNRYGTSWKTLETTAAEKAEAFLATAAFSNIKAMHTILARVPAHTTVHLGNSGTVRYAQMEPARHDLSFQSNRGTSGIDGSLSTAVGAAMVSKKPHLAILGDLSFMYDSNALWNGNFPSNLKIIVLNDKGGGIFRLLDGPDRMPFFGEFSVTHHPVAMEHLAKAFGMNFLYANNDYTLERSLDTLFAGEPGAGMLEVDTSGSENSGIFKLFYKSIQP